MCRLFHKWGPWKATNTGDIVRASITNSNGIIVGSYLDQKRTCERCGKTQLHTEKTYV